MQSQPISTEINSLRSLIMNELVRWILAVRQLATRWVVPVLIVYWLVIFIGTHTPNLHAPLPNVKDKYLHFGAFMGLAFLLTWAIRFDNNSSVRRALLAAILCAFYGVFDELTQKLVRNRTADPWDFFADCLGAATGILLYFTARRLIKLAASSQSSRL